MTHEEVKKSGYVAIVGRPNVGKSTLLNALLGHKVSIISPKPQTTRHQILGIKTENGVQSIFIDTPGIHEAEKRAMNRYMNRLANAVMIDTDVILFVVDSVWWKEEDEFVLKKIMEADVPTILVINKIDDLAEKARLLPHIQSMQSKYPFAHIIPVSAKKKENLQTLQQTIDSLLPVGPALFPEDQLTDKNEKFQVAEIIREKLIRCTEQELPYTTTVVIESMKENEEKLLEIHAVIWVEREGQKPIVIGKGGARLKQIGTAARKDIVKLLDRRVFLHLWVKVKNDWTNDELVLGSLGYE